MPLRERISAITHLLGCSRTITRDMVQDMLPALLEISPELESYLRDAPAESAGELSWQENLLANHLLYVDFPYVDRRVSKADAAIGLMTCYELLQMLSGYRGDERTDALAALFHLTEHTAFYYNVRLLAKRAAQR